MREKTDDCEISPQGSGRRDDEVNERDVPLFSSIETSFFLRERCSIARSKQREREMRTTTDLDQKKDDAFVCMYSARDIIMANENEKVAV